VKSTFDGRRHPQYLKGGIVDLKQYEVPLDKLRWECDPKIFDFECTGDLAPLREFIGQERATTAVNFGLNMGSPGYNIFVAGITGTGKTSMVKSYIEKIIREREARGQNPDLKDWCYLYNFKDPDCPVIVDLPQGQGKTVKNELDNLLTKIRQELGRAFATDEYKDERQQVLEKGQKEQQRLFEEISTEARQQGFQLQMTPSGPLLIPLVEDKPMQESEYLALEPDKKKELDDKQSELRKKLQVNFEAAASIQRDMTEQLQKIDKEIGEYTISRLFGPLFERYREWPKLDLYLTDLKGYILDNLELFKASEEPVNPVFGLPNSQIMGGRNPFLPFQVNVFVDNSEAKCPPIVVESNPNFGNMFGKIERRFLFGGYLSDHTMLKPGALAQANGGYLLLSVNDVLSNPGVWPAFKRALKTKEVKIEDPFEQFGLIAPQGLRPEAVPLDVKVFLIGDNMVYQVLSAYDEDFWEIFKVKADFNFEIDRSRDNMLAYAAFLSGCCEECKARHFEPAGVAKVIEYSSRMVADQEKMSSRFAQIKDWIEEANYWADRDKAKYISAAHVKKALDERLFRHDLIDERIRDMINRGTIMIDTGGSAVGQVNGLSVYSLGDISFGRPSRITARTFLGRGGIINIERESELSGPIHNKGVMILSGYLGSQYAQDKPLSLSASLCFEQSYEGIDGDSASSTELYAILSSLADVPIKQSIAVTGSVNQKGEVQPIGGVNQKIEGFFKVCQARGLTGEQGVLIPHQNVRNLMLREDVVDAVREGKFHIYSAGSIDEGIEILTGVPFGKRRRDGTYPRNSINHRVDAQLKGMAERLKGFYDEEKKESGQKK
jgi:predicted ATP-dependent protease